MNFDTKIPFTSQELKVIHLVCKEFSDAEIGGIMHLKTATIANYKRKVQKKIGARNEVGIALYALFRGMLSKPKI